MGMVNEALKTKAVNYCVGVRREAILNEFYADKVNA